MKKNKFNIMFLDFKSTLYILLLVIGISSCKDTVNNWSTESIYQVMTEYIEERPELYSEFGEMLEYTGLKSLLSTRGPFTLFLPTNDAINEWYEEIGVSSYQDIQDSGAVSTFVYNHIIGSSVVSQQIGLGALPQTNVLGDYIVSDFEGIDIRLNKKAIITQRDIELSNGYIHEVNKTIPITTKSLYQTLSELPGYTIFTEGIDLAGLKDTLDQIEFEYGDFMVRNRFTVLAVADTTYNRYGINNAEELVNRFKDDDTPISDSENGFYQYMVYHCVKGTHYLSDLSSGTYTVISEENHISVTISDDYKLNLDNMTGEYTSFYVSESNYTSKNGSIHTVDDLFEAPEPSPVTINWEVTDHIEITSGDWFVEDGSLSGEQFHKWEGGIDHFQNIKFDGDYIQYYYKNPGPSFVNSDCLNMLGYGWVEVTTPLIMKGKYELKGRCGGTSIAVYVDGVKVAPYDAGDSNTGFGTFVWEETSTHVVKVQILTFGALFWDNLIFTPVN